jgi:ribosomal protein L20A (L18A)
MVTEYNERGFVPIMNFYKKRNNWRNIFERAAEAVAPGARDEAENIVYSHFGSRTGDLGKSITVDVYAIEDTAIYDLSSDHDAAEIIEYGGYSPMPPVYKESIQEYANLYGVEPGAVAKGIHKNQPFSDPHPFLRPAANNAIKRLNKEVVAQFKAAKP